MTILSSGRDALPTLYDLIETCRDGEGGFRHAAQHVESRGARSLFESCARQAAQFADELRAEVRQLGGNPARRNMFDDLAQPGWMAISDKAAGEDETASVTECVCGVEALERAYDRALETGLPRAVRSRIERQRGQVREVSERIHALAGPHPFGPRARPGAGSAAVRRSRAGRPSSGGRG